MFEVSSKVPEEKIGATNMSNEFARAPSPWSSNGAQGAERGQLIRSSLAPTVAARRSVSVADTSEILNECVAC
jgi:hypothetical protein